MSPTLHQQVNEELKQVLILPTPSNQTIITKTCKELKSWNPVKAVHSSIENDFLTIFSWVMCI